MWKNNLILNLRNLWRNKGKSFISIFGFSVGLAGFILISLWIQNELSYDKFHKQKDQLHLLTITHASGVLDPNVPYAIAPLLKDDFSEMAGFTRIYNYGKLVQSFMAYQDLNGSRTSFNEENIILVDQDFFSMFTYSFVIGNGAEALKDPNSVILREETARKYFGGENPIGKVLNLNNQRDLTVVGVIRIPDNSHLQTDFIIPLRSRLDTNWNWRDQSFVMLKKNTNVTLLRDKISGFMNKKMPYKTKDVFKLGLLPITQVHLGFGQRIYVTVFTLIAFLVLLIACINYTNLTITRSIHRGKEIGLRKVVGARKVQLFKQFLGDSLLVTGISFCFSLVMVKLLIPLLNYLTGKQLIFGIGQNIAMILYMVVLVLAVGVLSGLYPAFYLSRIKPVESLKGMLPGGGNLFRIVSVTGQFAISLLLIISTVVIFQQVHFIRQQSLGLSVDQVLKVPINRDLLAGYKTYKDKLIQNRDIHEVTAAQSVPFNADHKTNGLKWEGMDPNHNPNVRYSINHFGFFNTFGIELVKGRDFRENSQEDLNNYVINEKAVETMGFKNPIGKSMTFWGRKGRIIGVVKNYHHVPLHREIMPQVFSINPQNWPSFRYVFIKISPQNLPQTIEYIRKQTELMAPSHPFSYSFLNPELNRLYQSEKKMGEMIGYFAFFAILLSCLGLFGLAHFMLERKIKEIGIRRVLGASIPGILNMLNRQFLKWVLWANLFAWPLGFYAMSKWLKGFAYKTTLSIWVFIISFLIVGLVAIITVSLKAARVAVRPPVESLRYE